MKDREQNQTEGVQMPPTWCSGLCRNAMNEICVESCAVRRDCSAFDPKPGLDLADMPPFPLEESGSMTKEEKFTSVTIYLSKVVDHLQGRKNERIFKPIQRHDPHRSPGGQVSANQQSTGLFAGQTEKVAIDQNSEKRES
jgi:hypothetical protein